jgi:arabinose-5-phosphate isomerase
MKAIKLNQDNFDNHQKVARKVIECEILGLKDLVDKIDEVFSRIIEEICCIPGRVIMSGMGKSGHIARKITSTFASTGTPAIYIHPAEAGHGDLGMITKNDIVMLFSNSGETPELAPIIDYCKRFSIKIIGISRRNGSTLIKSSDLAVVLPDTPEASSVNAPTTSAIMMMAYGDAIAVALHNKRDFTDSDFKIFHPGGNIGAKLLRMQDLMHMGKDIPIITETETIAEAILIISSKRLGCVGVVDDFGKLIGMITDGDLRRHIHTDISNTTVKDIMTINPVTLRDNSLASEALCIMNRKCITNIFVVDDNKKPIGIIHVHDLLRAGVV